MCGAERGSLSSSPGRSIVCREDSRRRPTKGRRGPRFDRWPLLLRRCFCRRNNEGESRRRDSNLGFPAACSSSPLPPMIPPRLLSPLPSRSTGAFRRFYSVCFRAPRSGRKSVGPPPARSRSHRPFPRSPQTRRRKEGVDEEIMTNVERGRR